jgi:hypothetical protein
MNNEYIKGAKDRANKIERSPMMCTNDYHSGYNAMSLILSSIETEILTATIRYKVVAENFVKKLEEDFRDRINAERAGHPALDAFPATGDQSS